MRGLTIWRHPLPRLVEGLCIGRSEVPVDRRKSKRLAHRIRLQARRDGAPRIVVTSSLSRAADVGRWLARWGWQHRIDPRLSELDFGAWQGRAWAEIDRREINDWCADFAAYSPGGGESTRALLERCAAFLREPHEAALVVGHAGWISAMLWLARYADEAPSADSWPAAVRYGQALRITPVADPEASASSPTGWACSIPTARRERYRPTR